MRAPAVDAHLHLWRYSPEDYAWIDDSMSALRRDFLSADLEAEFARAGIDGGVAVQARQSLAETEFLLECQAACSKLWGVVGWVDLRAPDVDRTLARYAPRLAGVRHIVQAEPDPEFMLGSDFQRGIRALEAHALVYDILIFPPQLRAAERLVAAHPRQRFVLDHLAKPLIRERRMEPWASELRSLARHPNVELKLSGMVTEADWASWTPEVLRPYIETAFEAFGPGRVLFGSDWPVCLLGASYARWREVVERAIEPLSADERAAVLGGNAVRCYSLRAT
jgi:L-fuconolactonase